MAEISETAAMEIAEGAEGVVVASEANDETESSVCLKKFPSRYVLGASCDVTDTYKFYAFDDINTANAQFEDFVGVMRRTGTPFGPLS